MKAATLDSGIFLRYREGAPDLPGLFCIHGYGASGASCLEAFEAPELRGLRGLIDVEGNLTAADTLISGKAAAADDIEAWRRSLIEELRPRAAEDAAFRRYLEDLARASPSALREWAVDTVAEFIAVRAG